MIFLLEHLMHCVCELCACLSWFKCQWWLADYNLSMLPNQWCVLLSCLEQLSCFLLIPKLLIRVCRTQAPTLPLTHKHLQVYLIVTCLQRFLMFRTFSQAFDFLVTMFDISLTNHSIGRFFYLVNPVLGFYVFCLDVILVDFKGLRVVFRVKVYFWTYM